MYYLSIIFLAAFVPPAPSEPENAGSSDIQIEQRQSGTKKSIGVQQILPYELEERSAQNRPDEIENVRNQGGKETDVSQLPRDIEVVDGEGAGPESAIVRTVNSPEARLYSQVAEVWELIRQRGQQPTPELIAREIGPESLASFLDQNPGAANIFGRDSDSFPLPGPTEVELPDGSGTITLPPSDGGGS